MSDNLTEELKHVISWHEKRASRLKKYSADECLHLAMAEEIKLAIGVIEAAKMVYDVSKFAEFESGICCCGEQISRHTKNHEICDSGLRYGNEALSALTFALFKMSRGDMV